MTNQVLSDSERKLIRAEIYTENNIQPINYDDGKIHFFVQHSRGKSVLDLGSVDHYENNWKSQYWLFRALVENSAEILGIDYYEKGVIALHEKGFPIVHGDAQNFAVDKKFDVVTAGDLIEHLPNLDGFISCIKNSLKENGELIISTPNPWCWKYFLYHIFYGKLDRVNREHVSWFCLATIENLFSRYGFELIEYSFSSRRRFERMAPLPGRIKHTTINILLKKI